VSSSNRVPSTPGRRRIALASPRAWAASASKDVCRRPVAVNCLQLNGLSCSEHDSIMECLNHGLVTWCLITALSLRSRLSLIARNMEWLKVRIVHLCGIFDIYTNLSLFFRSKTPLVLRHRSRSNRSQPATSEAQVG
jgi:hypothetical protein